MFQAIEMCLLSLMEQETGVQNGMIRLHNNQLDIQQGGPAL